MSRKTHNLLTKGLTSELYLLAYIEPNNVRQLGQILQNTSGHPTNYSKLNPAIHNLTIAKYLKAKQNDDRYFVNIEKLAIELENILKEKNILLDEIEKKYLVKVLEENEFFKMMTKDIIQKIQNQKKGKHEVNALEVFSERIGMMISQTLVHKKMDKQERFTNLNDDSLSFEEKMEGLEAMKEEWRKISKELDNGFTELLKTMPKLPLIEEVIIPMFKNMPSFMIFFLIPEKTLMKLGNLWESFVGVQLSLQVYDFDNES